jgi:hypothetical protein
VEECKKQLQEIHPSEQPSSVACTLKEMQKCIDSALGRDSRNNESFVQVKSKAKQRLSASEGNITDQILQQVRLLKANNLKIQALTQADHAVLDETSVAVERGVGGMKRQNAQVAAFLSSAWKHTGMYWMGILLSILMFIISFLVIKVFPR